MSATPLTPRSLRDELSYLLDSTRDIDGYAYDRETLLMRLEVAFQVRLDAERAARTPAAPASGDARVKRLEGTLRQAMRRIASVHECVFCETRSNTDLGVEGHEESCVYACALRGQP